MAVDDEKQNKTCTQKWDEFKQAIYNSEKGEVLGRTGTSWGTVSF